MINKQHTQIANAFDFYFMSSQYKMREFFLTGLISGPLILTLLLERWYRKQSVLKPTLLSPVNT